MNKDDIKKQLNNSEKPTNTKPLKETDSTRRIIELALTDAEKGNLEGINDIFFASVKKVREISEPDFLQIKARYGKVEGLLASDLNKVTKIYKKTSTGTGDDPEGKRSRTSKADMLIEVVSSKGSFFHNADKEVFVSFQVDDINKETGEQTGIHFETWNIRSRGFKSWASYLFFTTHATTPGDTAIGEAIDTLEGVGLFEGNELEVNLRYAFHDERVFVDLGCDHWKVVEISIDGYKVIESQNAPVKFVRSNGFRPLPSPKQGGDISLLWDHLNVESKDGRFLLVAWVLEAMRVKLPFPVLEIVAQQGCFKSSLQKRLRKIIDPNKAELRSAPRSVEDIFVSARNSHILSYDNLSHLTANTSDAFCIISLGGSDATRKLYSNGEEDAFFAQCPIMMNGISTLSNRADLGDRTISIELCKAEYKDEQKLEAQWEKDLPLILGALYGLMSETLSKIPEVVIEKSPRMADFARLGQAMLNAQGIGESFTEIYMRNRDRVVLRAIESSPVAQAIIKLVDEDIFYRGTKGGLMDRLIHHQPKHFDRASYPKSVKGLADALRRLAPALKVQGIEVIEDKKRYKDGYHVEIRKINTSRSEPDISEVEV